MKSGEPKESFDFVGQDASDPSKYPSEVEGLKESMDAFKASLVQLAHKLLRSFALSLDLEDLDYFIKRHQALEDPTIVSKNAIRSNYYFPMDPSAVIPPDAIRMQEHKDWGT